MLPDVVSIRIVIPPSLYLDSKFSLGLYVLPLISSSNFPDDEFAIISKFISSGTTKSTEPLVVLIEDSASI